MQTKRDLITVPLGDWKKVNQRVDRLQKCLFNLLVELSKLQTPITRVKCAEEASRELKAA